LTFYLVRLGKPCRCPIVFVGLYLSLRPERVPNPSLGQGDPAAPSRCPRSERGVELARSGLPFHRAEAPPRYSGAEHIGRCRRPDILERNIDQRRATRG
jgi:hypothetical protein